MKGGESSHKCGYATTACQMEKNVVCVQFTKGCDVLDAEKKTTECD